MIDPKYKKTISPVLLYYIIVPLAFFLIGLLAAGVILEGRYSEYESNIAKIVKLEGENSSLKINLQSINGKIDIKNSNIKSVEKKYSILQAKHNSLISEFDEIYSMNNMLQEQNSNFRRRLNSNVNKFFKLESINIRSCSKISIGNLCLNRSHKYGVFECSSTRFETLCDQNIKNYSPFKRASILQYILKRNGYNIGKIDRDAGKKTSSALSAFLSDNHKLGRKYDIYLHPKGRVDMYRREFPLLIKDMISLHNLILR